MKPKTLAVLAAVVALLGALAWFERERPSTDERKKSEKKLFDVAADDIESLTIEWNGATVVLERDPRPAAAGADSPAFPPAREWRLVAPLTARADRALADRLAGTLAGLESERRLQEADRAQVGLAPARGRVLWKSGDGSGALELGGDVPASTSLVAAVDGGDPVVIARALVGDLDRAPGDWRAKEVLPAGRDEIERIRLVPSGGAGEVVLSRQGESFVVERPYADAADPDSVDPLLTDLTSLRVEKFLDAPLDPLADAGLAAGAGRLELALKGRSEPYVVVLGGVVADSELRYVRAGGQAFEARTRLLDALTREPGAWRSRRWTRFESWKVERLKVDAPEGPFELARRDGDWLRDGDKVPYTQVGDLLYAVTSARGERVEPGATAPPGAPRLTLVLADADGGEETLTVHGEVEGGVAARVSGRDVTVVLPAKAIEELTAKLAAVRAAKVEVAAEAAELDQPAGAAAPVDAATSAAADPSAVPPSF